MTRRPSGLRLITLLALAVAFTAFSLVAAAVQHERRYNASFDPAARVFQTYTAVGRGGQDPLLMASGLTDLAPALRAGGEGLQVARIARDTDPRALETESERYWISVTEADPQLLDVVDFGRAAAALRAGLGRPDGIVLTRDLAGEIFGAADPVGRTVRLGAHGYTVSGVIDRLDPNSSFQNDRAFISSQGPASSLRQTDDARASLTFAIGGATTFVRLDDPSPDSVGRVEAVADRHGSAALGRYLAANPAASGAGLTLAHHLVPVRDLEQAVALGARSDGARFDRGTLALLSVVAVIIVLVASLNAASLNVSQTLARAPAIAVRRAFGAGRAGVALEVIGQAVLSGLGAAVLGMATAFLLSGAFGALIDRPLPRWPDPATLATILAAAVLSGGLAGAYAAWITGRMRPREVLSARDVRLPGMGWIRPMLVTLQIGGGAATLVFAVAVSIQLDHLAGRSLGFEPGGVIAYRLPESLAADDPRGPTLLAAARVTAGDDVALAVALPTEGGLSRQTVAREGQTAEIAAAGWRPGYLETLGATLLAGAAPRSLESEQDSVEASTQAAVISATAARRLGFGSPSEAIGAVLTTERAGTAWRVSGVIADMPLGQLRNGDAATALVQNGAPTGFLIARAADGSEARLDEAVADVFPGEPIDRVALQDQVDIAFADLIRLRGLILAFAAVLTATAAIGVLAMTLDRARQMRKEAAVRRAFGAEATAIAGLLARRIITPVAIGFALGGSAGVLGARAWLSAYSDRAPFLAPSILIAFAVLLAATALAAAFEIWRLSVARPVEALRED
ncbi:ABC transporter permease (plasmid) [Brevundimonas staleyi]|uniref:ABC transporter permease n=1 Tax=Brevundimonas staleyi TaxID=74326 RepID=A0ABW0FQC7_9CAUL